jgi:hypothetical protein
MWKTLLSAACAAALLGGTALAQTAGQPSTFDRSQAPQGQVGADRNVTPKMPSEAERRALSERGRRSGEQGAMPSQENPSGTNSLPPTGAQARGDRAGTGGSAQAGMECRGLRSEEETTRCLNRQSLARVSETPAGGAAGESRRDPMSTQGRNRDR